MRESQATRARKHRPDRMKSGLSSGLRLAQALNHELQELPADRSVLHDQRAEVPVGQPVAVEVRGGGDRRGPRTFVDQRDLSEVLARADLRARLPADGHGGLARVDQVEGRAARALLRHDLALLKAALFKQAGAWLKLRFVKLGEQRNARDGVKRSTRHQAPARVT